MWADKQRSLHGPFRSCSGAFDHIIWASSADGVLPVGWKFNMDEKSLNCSLKMETWTFPYSWIHSICWWSACLIWWKAAEQPHNGAWGEFREMASRISMWITAHSLVLVCLVWLPAAVSQLKVSHWAHELWEAICNYKSINNLKWVHFQSIIKWLLSISLLPQCWQSQSIKAVSATSLTTVECCCTSLTLLIWKHVRLVSSHPGSPGLGCHKPALPSSARTLSLG